MKFKNKKNELNFGNFPILNRFYIYKNRNSPKYKFKLIFKDNIISIAKPFPVNEIRPKYNWLTIFEPEDHLKELSNKLNKLLKINKSMSIGAFSNKDKPLTKFLSDKTKKTFIINPLIDFKRFPKLASYESLEFFFNKNIERIKNKYEKCDLFIIRHTLEHTTNLKIFLKSIDKLIKKDGYILIELPDCEKQLKNGDHSVFWEEHNFYFTENSIKNFLQNNGYKIVKFYRFKYPMEDSLTLLIKKTNKIKKSSYYQISSEKRLLHDIGLRITRNSETFIKYLKYTKKRIIFYGAGHTTLSFIFLLKIQSYVDFIIDDNPHKTNKYISFDSIKILSSESLNSFNNNYLYIFGTNPSSHKKILQKHKNFVDNGGFFYSIYPNQKNYIFNFLKS